MAFDINKNDMRVKEGCVAIFRYDLYRDRKDAIIIPPLWKLFLGTLYYFFYQNVSLIRIDSGLEFHFHHTLSLFVVSDKYATLHIAYTKKCPRSPSLYI